jgi:hypothetical protein
MTDPKPEIDRLDWHWPVRIGLVARQGAAAQRRPFEELRRGHPSFAGLTRLADTAEANAFDLLVLPATAAEALALLLASPAAVRAHLLLVFDDPGRLGDAGRAALEELRELTQAAGIAVVPARPDGAAAYVRGLIYALSHDRPLDAAVQAPALFADGRHAVLFADPALIEASRIRRFAERVARRLAAKGGAELDLEAEVARALGLVPGRQRADAVRRRFLERLAFDEERQGATWSVRLAEAVRKPTTEPPLRLREEPPQRKPPGPYRIPDDEPYELGWPPPRPTESVAPAEEEPIWRSPFPRERRAPIRRDGRDAGLRSAERPVPESRFLQAEVRAGGSRRDSFVAGESHRIGVWIGAPELRTRPALRVAEPFPDAELPEDEESHLLTVVFSEPDRLDRPQVRTVLLPRTGASSRCSFTLDLPRDAREVEARLTVLYENRVLQTARLSGRVGEPAVLESEMVVRPGMRNLSGQQRFDGSLILHRGADGVPRLTVGAGYGYESFSIEKLDQAVEEIEARIDGTPWGEPEFASFDAPGSQKLLRYLARKGSLLYRELLRYCAGGPISTGDGPVQLVSAVHGARIPLELLYSRAAPAADAPLCPGWRRALIEGTCSCADDGTVVCPLGFWGFRRVLERHRFQPGHAAGLAGRAYALKDEAGDAGAVLRPLAGVVLGASERVERISPAALHRTRQALGRLGCVATGWEDWVGRVRSSSPSLLVLLPHTGKDDDDVPTLEIQGERLAADRISRGHVLGPAGNPKPIVLLLGCNTDNAALPFESFVPMFADQEAAVVVTSVSRLLGRHAAPLAALFVELLAELPNDGSHRFGEVMRRIRRRSALAGPPVSLVLKAYGDADWRI